MTSIEATRRLAIGFTAVIALAAAAGILVPAGSGWDFANFYDTGRRILGWQIADLYDASSLVTGGAPQGGMSFWGAPLSALLYAPLGWLPPGAALIAFKVVGTAAFFAALWILYRHNLSFVEETLEARWRFAAMYSGAVLLFQPFWSVYRVGGQTTPLVFLLLVVAMIAHIRDRTWLTAGCLVAAVAIKPAFLIAIVALGILGGWRMLLALTAWGVAWGLVSLLLLGWPVHLQFIDVMRDGLRYNYSWLYNSSLYTAAESLKERESTPVSPFVNATVVVVKLLMLSLFAWLAWWRRTRTALPAARRHFDFLLALTFCLALSQTVWEHYLALLFPLIAYVIASYRQFSRGALALIAVILAFSITQNVTFTALLRPVEITSSVALIVLGIFKSIPLLLSIILLVRYHEEFFTGYQAGSWRRLAIA